MSTSYLFSHDGFRDSLTHLYAPSFMYDVVERRLKSGERNRTPLTLIKVVIAQEEIDGSVDEPTIIDVAEVLNTQLRADDIIGRMGIAEFLIVLGTIENGSRYESTISTIYTRCQLATNARLQFSAIESQHQERLSNIFDRLDSVEPLPLITTRSGSPSLP